MMFKKMIHEFGTIDILVNNAGLQKDAPIDQMTLADWQFVLDVNLTGQFLCSREAIREFPKSAISCADSDPTGALTESDRVKRVAINASTRRRVVARPYACHALVNPSCALGAFICSVRLWAGRSTV